MHIYIYIYIYIYIGYLGIPIFSLIRTPKKYLALYFSYFPCTQPYARVNNQKKEHVFMSCLAHGLGTVQKQKKVVPLGIVTLLALSLMHGPKNTQVSRLGIPIRLALGLVGRPARPLTLFAAVPRGQSTATALAQLYSSLS